MEQTEINKALEQLPDLDTPLKSRGMLDSLIDHAEIEITGSRNRRITWLIATTVATAKIQQIIDSDGRALFLLKGGTMLRQWRRSRKGRYRFFHGKIRCYSVRKLGEHKL